MAVFLNDHVKPDPSLMEAVKIVIKYEIQSLLTKLADTGEEYLVLTVSPSDNSCGHIGSAKGEGFVKNSSLELIKEQFLHFCSEEPKPLKNAHQDQIKIQQQPPLIKSEVTQISRAQRRKSTPRCKSQPPEWQTQQEIQEIQNYAMNEQSSIEQSSIHPSVTFTNDLENENSEALDLSEKQVGGYSYTLDCSGDSYGSNIQSSLSDASKYQSNEGSPVSKYNGFHEEPAAYTWKEEVLPIDFNENRTTYATDIPLKYVNDIYAENYKIEPKFDADQVKPKSENDAELSNTPNSNSNDKMALEGQGSRRKPRKAPVKRRKSDIPLTPNSTNLQINNNVSEDDRKIIDHGSPGKLDITDMKSAFIEIGNMAKCLICNKILANKNNRTFHWRSHVGDKRYRCDICNKAFTHPSNMRSHRKIHTDEKPFPCELCDRRFRRRDYLLQHLERFHYSARPNESLITENKHAEANGMDNNQTDANSMVQ